LDRPARPARPIVVGFVLVLVFLSLWFFRCGLLFFLRVGLFFIERVEYPVE
jgi:hypothetical protein